MDLSHTMCKLCFCDRKYSITNEKYDPSISKHTCVFYFEIKYMYFNRSPIYFKWQLFVYKEMSYDSL